MFDNLGEGTQTLALIVKTDVGARSAVQSLTLSTDEVRVARRGGRHLGKRHQPGHRVQRRGDRLQRRAEASAKKLAESNGIDVRYYNIIYDAVDEVKAAMSGMLAPKKGRSHRPGRDPRGLQHLRIGNIAGCMVLDGLVKRDSQVRLLRNNVVQWTGHLESLRRFKDDVKEVKSGFDCGLRLRGNNDIQVGDQLEVFEIRKSRVRCKAASVSFISTSRHKSSHPRPQRLADQIQKDLAGIIQREIDTTALD